MQFQEIDKDFNLLGHLHKMTSYLLISSDGKKLEELQLIKGNNFLYYPKNLLVLKLDGIRQPNACTSSVHFYGLDMKILTLRILTKHDFFLPQGRELRIENN